MLDEILLANQIYCDWPMHFDPLLKECYIDPEGNQIEIDTGIKVMPNGDAAFRVYAPGADSIVVAAGNKKLELEKGEDGIFWGILKYDPLFAGPHSLDFIVDGTCFLYPYAPISWHRNRPVNYIDIPDKDTPYILLRNVPHGAIIRELYWSKKMNRWQRCIIYTPPGYMAGNEEYPVLYLQHGATENEITWEYNGRVSSIMDNLIADKLGVPFIIVMNDGMVTTEYDGSIGSAFGDMLINDCIPFIERTYRVKKDKWNRALAGLSMGSMQACEYGLSHPELFGYLGLFSGFMRDFTNSKIRKDNDYLNVLNDNERFQNEYKLFFRSMGDGDSFWKFFLEDDDICERSGITKLNNFHRVVYHGQCHEFGAWRRALYDFSQMIFKG